MTQYAKRIRQLRISVQGGEDYPLAGLISLVVCLSSVLK